VTGRERIEAAFSADGARDVPAVICYENVFLRDHWTQITKHPWQYLHVLDPKQQMAWTRDLVEALSQDWLQMFPWTAIEDEEHTTIECLPEGVFKVHKKTGDREQFTGPHGIGWGTDDDQSVHTDFDTMPESFEAIDASIPLYSENEVDRDVLDGRQQVANALLDAFGQTVWPYRHVSSPLWKTYNLWGFEGMMLMIATQPELVRHACDRYLEVALRNIREAAQHGARGIWIEECLTDMISPEAFAMLNVPYLRRVIEAIREAGMKSIYYFCGNTIGKWDQIMSLGMDAIALEERKKNFNNEIVEIVDRVQGRCVVLGNLDALSILQNGSEKQLKEEIQRQIAAGRRNGSRFIMSLGSPVTPVTPVERVRLYCDLVHELGAT